MVLGTGEATPWASVAEGTTVPCAGKVTPFVDRKTRTSTAGPANRPSEQAATRSVGVEAASTAGPPTVVQGACQATQFPPARRAPLTTTRSFWTTHPEPPCSTICATGTGPAP